MSHKFLPKILYSLENKNGFTLVEAMISIVLLAIMGVSITMPYTSGSQALNAVSDQIHMDQVLKSRMEILVGTDFDSLRTWFDMVVVGSQTYLLFWSVTFVDMDGDTSQDVDAKQVSLMVMGFPDISLTTILVDGGDRIGKI